MKKKEFYLFFIVISLSYSSSAQQGITSAGMTTNGNNGSMSIAIGQLNYINVTNANSILTGVLQVQEKHLKGYNKKIKKNINILIWPNPVINNLYIKMDGDSVAEFTYQIFNTNGQRMMIKKIAGSATIIGMQNYITGPYFIHITCGDYQNVIFKIIKL